jgi:hypothetical protein
MINANSPDRKHVNLNNSTPKKQIYSKSPLRCVLKKSKRRDCTPDSPVKFFTEQKSVRTIHSEKLVNSEREKKNFLTLIEESLNEVSDSYFGLLGRQSTPDSLFTSIFMEKLTIEDTKVKIDDKVINQLERLMTNDIEDVKYIY